MYGSGMGSLKVFLNDNKTNQDTKVFSVAGNQGNEWFLACVDITASSNTDMSVTFSAKHGDSCNSIIGLDDVTVEEGSCPEPLTGIICDVEDPFYCQTEINCTEGSSYIWQRHQGKTQSVDTGPLGGDGTGMHNGHFYAVDGSVGNIGHESFLWFPAIKSPSPASLHFKYHMRGEDFGSLHVKVKNVDTGDITELWKIDQKQEIYWESMCLILPSNKNIVVYFIAVRGSGYNSDIAIDDIEIVQATCSSMEMSCSFDDKYKCGYTHAYLSNTLTPWTLVSHSDQTKPAALASLEQTGSFISSGPYSSYIVSPKHVSNSSVSCVTFDYFTLTNQTQSTQNNSLLQLQVIPKSLKDYNVWKGKETKFRTWNQAQVEVNETEFRIMFQAVFSDGLKGVDNVKVSDGPCSALECPNNGSSCMDQYCIPRELVCDKNFDCEDKSDEKLDCGQSISCNFSTDYACGYMNKTVFPPWQIFSNMRTTQGVVYDSTTNNSSGSFIGIQTDLPFWTSSLRSPFGRIAQKSCLKFYYMGSATGISVTALYSSTNKMVFNDTIFSNTVWRPGQAELDKGDDVYLTFDVNFNISSLERYFGLDDVTLTPGKCLPLDCPSTLLQCGSDNICVNKDIMCNDVKDCPSGDDESGLYCPYTIFCDFEDAFMCGYGKYSDWFRRHGFYYFLPMMDHTYGNISGHYMTFNSTTPKSSVFKSTQENITEDGCIHFFYNMEGKNSAELRVNVIQNGAKQIAWYGNGLNIERDDWKEAWFPVKNGITKIEFEAFADTYFFQSSIVAIDDVSFSNGACPSTGGKCKSDEFKCTDSGTCIPYYHVDDQYPYCFDASDEGIKDSNSVNGALLSCTFEPGETCFLTNSTTDNYNWNVISGSTSSSATGPDSAHGGIYYTYFEASSGLLGATASLESRSLYYSNATCLRFYYHMYGSYIGTLTVYLNNIRKWVKSYNQGNQWFKQEIVFSSLNGEKIYLEARRGTNFQGDISLDDITLLPAKMCSYGNPPQSFTVEPQCGSPVQEGGVKVLFCRANSIPAASYSWLKDGQVLQNGNQSTLIMSNIDRTKAGTYRCIAYNYHGAITSKSCDIVIAYLDPFSPSPDENVTVSSGNAIKIDFPALNSVPTPSVVWKKNGQQMVEEGASHQVTFNNDLILLDTQLSDNNTMYNVTALNGVTGEFNEIHTFTLYVSDNGSAVIPPTVEVAPVNTTVQLGSNVTKFECVVNARPLTGLTTEWYRINGNQRELIVVGSQNKYLFSTQYKRQLLIANPVSSDSGLYECEAVLNTTDGQLRSVTASAYLDVLTKPQIISQIKQQYNKTYGESIEVECKANGNPVPTIHWYYNTEEITTSNSSTSRRVTADGKLIITSLGYDDSGMYQCFARNDAGETSNATWIRVLESVDINSDTYAVRLVGGHDRSYGRLEIKFTGKFYLMSSYRWNDLNSKVVCKQLGFTKKHKTYYNSEYGIGRAPFLNTAFNCKGNESHLEKCSSFYNSYNPFSVAIACSNSDCFHGDIACPIIGGTSSNVTCIRATAWCDGQFDCPGGQDELNCANCTDSEFECQDHSCISGSLRCDGIDQCKDGSDEYKCVQLITSNNTVKVNSKGEWYWLCSDNVDRTVASHLCSIAGYGWIDNYHAVPWNSEGLTVYPTDNPDGVVINNKLVYTSSCSLLGLTCEKNLQCGLQSMNHPGIQSFVINGQDVVLGEWPWHVAIYFYDSYNNKDYYNCGGSLIHPEWVITAAHCVVYYSYRTYYIYAGSIHQSKQKVEAQMRNLSSSPFIHSGYYRGSLGDDIALLRLSQPVYMNDKVGTVCLSPYMRKTYDNCYVTGWGKTHVDIHLGNVFPDVMQEVKVQANKDFNWCNSSYYDWTRQYVVHDGICVDNRKQYSPVCNGDSGGPLVCQNEEGRWELLGVASYGYRGCFKDHVPSVYTSVYYHWDWINRISNLGFVRVSTPPPNTVSPVPSDDSKTSETTPDMTTTSLT